MTAVNCMVIGLIICVLGFVFGITGSLVTNKFSVQEKFIHVGGYMVGAGIVIAVLAWIYWLGMLLM